MCTMNGTIGHCSTDVWKPYTSVNREKHLDMVNSYLATLPKQLSASTLHSKKLSFMADNWICQLTKPRIGIFADRAKTDPLHCEINAWQHVLDLLYIASRFKEMLLTNLSKCCLTTCLLPLEQAQGIFSIP